LGTLAGYASSAAQGINAAGAVVGYATTSTGRTQAFLYSGGSMVGLGTPKGDANSAAEAINSAGQIVGYAYPTSGPSHAFLYSNGTMTDLGTLSGDSTSQALAINDSGQVVGYSGGSAFLYSGGAMTNLNSLISAKSGWTLQEALGISDLQEIVAVGVGPNSPGQQHAVLLSPEVPGDANGDGKVDINDLTIVLSHFGESKQTWSAGDFNGDGKVDINDLTIVLANFGQSIGVSAGSMLSAVPEPGALALLLAATLLGLLGYARRKRK
jgi:probable HAF family extracellular repeat protein